MADTENQIPTNVDAPVESTKSKKGGGHKVLKHRDHVLLRPDTYVGSTEKSEQDMWVYNADIDKMEYRQVTYAPALYKIFDEIIVNSADHKQRDGTMKNLKVEISKENGTISVYNDGNGIPIVESEEIDEKTKKKLWVPEMIFGVLLSGSNYNDDEERLGGGRNGYGAKLTNIFSTEFTLETIYVNPDTKEAKEYKQTWTDNMSKKGKPSIKKVKAKKPSGYTKVTFKPDFARFNMNDGLDDDIIAMIRRRAFDMAGTTPKDVKVTLDGTVLPIKDFKSYCDMYLPSKEECELQSIPEKTLYFESVNERWEVGVTLSQDEEEQHVSFVNSIATTSGGTHVKMIQKQIAERLAKFIEKKKKKKVKTHQIKKSLWVFCKSLIVNPKFGSQTKETLKTKESEFEGVKNKGKQQFKCTLSEKFLKKLEKSVIVQAIVAAADSKEQRQKARAGGKKKHKIVVPKLEDANWAGKGKKAAQCTLILTEGDSAKSLAMAGISVVGRDKYGVFPLKGKLLNVRDANHSMFMKNTEIQNIMKIMGLQVGKKYEDVGKLRYGHLMIMTDQDHDGSHIKGLIINFIHKFWPSLLRLPGFLQVFVTPIIKASKGSKKNEVFYTMPEYEEWRDNLSDQGKSWRIKYYKGLGTSTSKEAKEYFKNIKTNKLDMLWTDEAIESNMVDMCFNKKRADDRKDWILSHEEGSFVNFNSESMSISDFIRKELVLFSIADNERSLPNVVDGFKSSQRKVLFASFKRNLTNEIRVAQLAGYTSEHAAYHHGETSLCGTIVGMAQTFVGSNNINLLYPGGQFGTRFQGGNDAASPRYIHTQLSKFARLIFHPDDDALLTYLDDDGVSIEPKYYLPIIPMLLVNGAQGIGTGWSSKVPNFNPRDLIENLRTLINADTPTMDTLNAMMPWYMGFEGTITREFHAKKGFEGRFTIRGCAEWLDDRTFRITELPVGTWIENYKNFLNDEKNFAVGFIEDINENHTDTTVDFEITLSEEAAKALQSGDDLFKKFKLETSISVTNMTCFDRNRKIRTFSSPEEILFDFFQYRMESYVERKKIIMERLEKEFSILDNKVRFILAVINGEMVINNRPKKDLMSDLRSQGYPAHTSSSKKKDDDDWDMGSRDYDYLLSMPLWNLTLEKVEKLKEQKFKKEDELEDLRATSEKDIWLKDLDELELALDEFDTTMEGVNKRRKRVGTGQEIVSQKIRIQGVYTAKRSDANVDPKDNFMADSFANNDNDVVEAPIDAFATNSNMMTTLADIKMTIEEDDEDADDVFEEAPKPKSKKSKKVNAKKRKSPVKKKASKKKAPAKKKATKKIVVDDDDEDFELPSVKVSATAKSKFTMNISDSDDSDEEFGSLMSRIKSRRTAGKPKPKYNFDSDSDDDFDMQTMTSEISSISRKISDDSGSMPSKTTKKKSKVISKKKKKAIVLSESEEDEDAWSPSSEEDDDDDSDFEL